MVRLIAHCPGTGVNSYVPSTVLSIVAGNQVPTTPFGEVNSRVGATVPSQKASVVAKSGVRIG